MALFRTRSDAARRVCVFIDGGAQHQDDARFARSGGGAYWSQGHPFNLSEQLWGPLQGSDRAEQCMVLAVVEVEWRPVQLFVDNDAARWELQQRLDPLLRPRYETGKHEDIWARVCEVLEQRAAGDVAVTWVKGHATQGHVD